MPTEQTRPIIEQIDRALTLLQAADNVRRDGGYAVEIDGVRITRVEDAPPRFDETPTDEKDPSPAPLRDGQHVHIAATLRDPNPDDDFVMVAIDTIGGVSHRTVPRESIEREN